MDIAKVSKDSQISVFFGAAEQAHSGGGIGVGAADKSFGLPGGDADVLQVKSAAKSFDGGKAANGVTITGLSNADNLTSGTVPITIPVRIGGSFYGQGDGLVQGSEGQTKEWLDQPVKYWTETSDGAVSAADTTPFGFNISYRQVVSGANENDKQHQTWTNAFIDDNKVDVHLGMHGITPVNPPNGTASVTFVPKTDGENGDSPWEMTNPEVWVPQIRGAKLITGATTPELTQEAIDAIEMKVDPVEGGFRVTILNIPENTRVSYQVNNIGLVGAANSAANASGIEGNVEATREPTAKILVDGQEWTQDAPFEVKPGEEYESTMVLGLGGNARIAHPVVTNEAGETVAEDPAISFIPGGEEKITFTYTAPEDAKDLQELKYKVTYDTGESAEASTWVKALAGCGCTVNYKGEEKPVQEVVDDLNKRLADVETKADDLEAENAELKGQLDNADKAIKDLETADKDLRRASLPPPRAASVPWRHVWAPVSAVASERSAARCSSCSRLWRLPPSCWAA